MAKHRLGKTLLGLAVLGTAVGGAVAYLMRGTKDKEQTEDLEEEFQEFDNQESGECSRSYITIPAGGKEEAEETESSKEEE